MQVQNIGIYKNYNNIQNNQKPLAAPSFQRINVISEGHWDKDILDAVLKNKEIKRFEDYLAKRNSVLELTTAKNADYSKSKPETLYSIIATFARKFKVMGIDEEVTPMANKEQTLENLKNFKCDKLIDTFEREEQKYNQIHHRATTQEQKMLYIAQQMKRKSLLESFLNLFS